MRFVAPKGSICINGVSLTVNEVDAAGASTSTSFRIRTRRRRSGELGAGAPVNIEIDVIARYLDRLMAKTRTIECNIRRPNGKSMPH